MPSRAVVYTSVSQDSARPVFGPPRPRPWVVLLQLQKQHFFDEQYDSFLCKLRAKANVDVVASKTAASALFAHNSTVSRPIVLATDEGLANTNNTVLRNEARNFVSLGGTLIFCGHFPSFTQQDNGEMLFAALDLPWKFGDYHRTDHEINPVIGRINTSGLTRCYSQKALHLRNVAKQDAVYLPLATSRVQSLVFPPLRIEDHTQTPVAFTSCGRGNVGYLGDVNGEEDTHKAVMAMCGLC